MVVICKKTGNEKKLITGNIIRVMISTITLFIGIFIILFGHAFIISFKNVTRMQIENPETLRFNGIFLIVLGTSLLLLSIHYITLYFSIFTFILSLLFLLIIIINWSFFETLGSKFTLSKIDFEIFIYIFLTFWIVKLIKDIIWSKHII